MNKLALLNFQGSFDQGFIVNLRIWSSNSPNTDMKVGKEAKLPSNPELTTLYDNWRKTYNRCIGTAYFDTINQEEHNKKQRNYNDCEQAEKELVDKFNQWLKSQEFNSEIVGTLRENLLPKEAEHRILIESNDLRLRKMPWFKWDLLKDLTLTEIGLSSPNFEIRDVTVKPKNKIRILTILGKDANIQGEIQKLSQAKIEIKLVTGLQELEEPLWKEAWDIIIFNGHSQTLRDGITGEFELSDTEKPKISDLRGHFNQAINRGLKLVIFNSCDGLGLAHQLGEGERLHLPQIVVMRELLPVSVAPLFLRYLFEELTQGKSLYAAMRLTKNRLLPEETKLPGISALPVICQNQATLPLQLFKKSRFNLKWIVAVGATVLVIILIALVVIKKQSWSICYNEGVELQCPASWKIQKDPIVNSVKLMPHNFADAEISLFIDKNLSTDTNQVNLDSYTDEILRKISRKYPDKLLNWTDTKVDGHDARQLVYDYQEVGREWQVQQVVTVVNGDAYVLTLKADKPNFSQLEPDFNKLLELLKINE